MYKVIEWEGNSGKTVYQGSWQNCLDYIDVQKLYVLSSEWDDSKWSIVQDVEKIRNEWVEQFR